jgi:hypothetical protein
MSLNKWCFIITAIFFLVSNVWAGSEAGNGDGDNSNDCLISGSN